MGFKSGLINAAFKAGGLAGGAAGYMKSGFFSRGLGQRAAVGGIMGAATGGYIGADNGFGGFLGGALAGAAAGAGMMAGQRRMMASSLKGARRVGSAYGVKLPGSMMLQSNRRGFMAMGALATAAAGQIGSSVLATNNG